jgi:hypothetical protein
VTPQHIGRNPGTVSVRHADFSAKLRLNTLIASFQDEFQQTACRLTRSLGCPTTAVADPLKQLTRKPASTHNSEAAGLRRVVD